MERRSYIIERPLPSLARYSRAYSVDGLPLRRGAVGKTAGNRSATIDERLRQEGGLRLSTFEKANKSTFETSIELKPPKSSLRTDPRPSLFNLSFESVPAASAPFTITSVSPMKFGHRLIGSLSASYVLYGLAACLLVAGMYVAVEGWRLNRQVSEQVAVLGVQSMPEAQVSQELTPSSPSVAPPVPPPKVCPTSNDRPYQINIASINVRACTVPIGVNGANQLESPKSIYDTGWYTGSARPPSDKGAVLINAHAGRLEGEGIGVFSGIHKLKPGAEIQIDYNNGEKLTFAVKKVKTVKTGEVDMGEMLRSADSEKLGLNMITCAGEYDESSKQFDSRVLVFAVQK